MLYGQGMMTPHEIQTIKNAGQLLLDRNNRVRRIYAAGLELPELMWDDPRACKFCISGAIRRAAGEPSAAPGKEVLSYSARYKLADVLVKQKLYTVDDHVQLTGTSLDLPTIWDNATPDLQDKIVNCMLNIEQYL